LGTTPKKMYEWAGNDIGSLRRAVYAISCAANTAMSSGLVVD
jgi:hypothetical protein